MRSFAGAKDDMSGILFTNRVAEFHIVVEKGINVKKGEEAGWLPLVFCNGGFILPDGGISPPACRTDPSSREPQRGSSLSRFLPRLACLRDGFVNLSDCCGNRSEERRVGKECRSRW